MKFFKKLKALIIALFTVFALFGFTQCEMPDDESTLDDPVSTSTPVIMPTATADNLINEISTYPEYNLISSLSVQGVNSFYLLNNSGATTTNIITDTALYTELGFLTYQTTTANSGDTGKIWLNGSFIDSSGSNTGFWGIMTFSPGINYMAFIIYRNGVAIGRSPLVKITSTIPASEYRFELTWNGAADLDLHIASGDWDTSANTGSWHVYFNLGSDSYTADGYNIELDVDNTEAYGPENIRIFEIPDGVDFKCWVEYYSGSGDMNMTLNLYRDNSLTPDHSWNIPDIHPDEIITIGTWTTPNTMPNTK